MTVPVQMGCEPGAVGAGALNIEREEMAELPFLCVELFVATAVSRDTDGALDTTDDIDGDGGVDVLVGVDSDDDFPIGSACRMLVMAVASAPGSGGQHETVGRTEGQEYDECLGATGSYSVTARAAAARIKPAAGVTDRSTARTP
ncbi:hypothetical protein [Streptomyces sp. NBC_01363]|uniref:hypothetical protein n=1 Tax=Streptomyces sp. NBC_01363 TaxID=2903840 RepID=UPI00225100F7|nr:hypothetical protein [Streptomyces sp. NBC_01363]MCX4734392.1 hypothetical protein [Streptomyces sp. NBC_01363]